MKSVVCKSIQPIVAEFSGDKINTVLKLANKREL